MKWCSDTTATRSRAPSSNALTAFAVAKGRQSAITAAQNSSTLQQVLASEQRHGLAQVENEGRALRMQAAGMGKHAVFGVRSHNAPGRFLTGQINLGRTEHGARVKRGDLAGGQVCGDEALRGEHLGHHTHHAGINAQVLQALHIIHTVATNSTHRHRLATQHVQRVGDIAGATAPLFTQAGHKERNAQGLDAIGQDVIFEVPLENRDRIKRDRTTYQHSLGHKLP